MRLNMSLVRERMKVLGYKSISELARAANLHRNTVNNMRAGRTFEMSSLNRLAEVLGVSALALLTDAPDNDHDLTPGT